MSHEHKVAGGRKKPKKFAMRTVSIRFFLCVQIPKD